MRSLHFCPQHTPGCELIHPTWNKVARGHRRALPHQALGGSRNSKFKPLSTEPSPQPICCFLNPDSLSRLPRLASTRAQAVLLHRPPKELDYGATLLVSKRLHLLPDLFLSGEVLPFSCLPSIPSLLTIPPGLVGKLQHLPPHAKTSKFSLVKWHLNILNDGVNDS